MLRLAMTACSRLALVLMLTRCSVQAPDYAGRSCEAGVCPGGYFCDAPSDTCRAGCTGGEPALTQACSDNPDNLLANGTFETGLSGWGGYNATLTSSSTAHGGQKSAGVCPATPGTFSLNGDTQQAVLNPKSGQTYSASAWVKTQSGTGTASLTLRAWSGGAYVGGVRTAPQSIDATWRQITAAYSLTADVAELDVALFGDSGTCLLADDLMLVPASGPSPECSSFTYSDWGACTNNVQTRTVVSSSPPGCTGGSPGPLSRSCGLPAGYMTIDQWEQRFQRWDTSTVRLEGYDINTFYSYDLSPDGCKQTFQLANKVNSYWMFQSAHCLSAAIKMWDATRKTTYLERSLAYFENMMANAVYVNQLTRDHAHAVGCVDSIVGGSGCAGSSYAGRSDASSYKGWHGWTAKGWDGGSLGDEYPLYEGEIWVNAGKLLVEMKALGLDRDSTYGPRYAALLEFVKKHVWEKWYVRGTQNFYRIFTYMTTPWVHLAMSLYLVSDNNDPQYSHYQDVYWNVDHQGLPAGIDSTWTGASLKGTQVKPFPGDPDAYTFYEAWNTTQAHESGHADRMIAFWTQCVRRDPACSWTLADLDKFCRTLRDHVWRDPAGANCNTFSVDGLTCNDGFSSAYMEWSRLGGLNTACGLDIQKRFEQYDAPGASKLNRGYANTRAASGALNARLLDGP